MDSFHSGSWGTMPIWRFKGSRTARGAAICYVEGEPGRFVVVSMGRTNPPILLPADMIEIKQPMGRWRSANS